MVPVEKGIRRMTKAAGGIFSGKKKPDSRSGKVGITYRGIRVRPRSQGWPASRCV